MDQYYVRHRTVFCGKRIVTSGGICDTIRKHCRVVINAGGYGGIGRRAGFRFQWETVQVQVLLSAVKECLIWALFLLCVISQNFTLEREDRSTLLVRLYSRIVETAIVSSSLKMGIKNTPYCVDVPECAIVSVSG